MPQTGDLRKQRPLLSLASKNDQIVLPQKIF
jgi:hypothetical protein